MQKSSKIVLTILASMLLVLSTVLFVQTPTSQIIYDADTSNIEFETSADWLDGWLYRKSHLIIAGSDAPVNYQMQFIVYFPAGVDDWNDVYCNENCRSDFGDIRFTSSDGVTEYDYWMKSYTEGQRALFWVEISESLTVNRTIYIYYGNEFVSTTSNGNDTFAFFEDFSRADSDVVGNGWTEDEHGSSVSIQDETLRVSGPQSNFTHIERPCPQLENIVLEGRIFANTTELGEWATAISLYWGPHQWIRLGWRSGESEFLLENTFFAEENEGTGASGGAHGVPGASGNSWYHFKIILSFFVGEYHSYDAYAWDNLPISLSRPSAYSGAPSMIILGRGYSDGDAGSYPHADHDNSDTEIDYDVTSYIDDVFIRTYCVYRPNHDEYGVEEDNLPDDTIEPTISHPDDVTFVKGTTGNNISWACTDEYPYGYVIFNNGTFADYDVWDTSPKDIVFELDSLEIGTYNITLLIRDMSGNMAFDTVWVTVTEHVTSTSPDGTLFSDNMILIIVISFVVGIVVVVVIFIKSKETG